MENTHSLLVPTISIYEVFKRILIQRGEHDALWAVAQMQQGKVVELDVVLALAAAKISYDIKLPMVDSIILATARTYNAELWTQDDDFKAMESVQYIEKRKGGA